MLQDSLALIESSNALPDEVVKIKRELMDTLSSERRRSSHHVEKSDPLSDPRFKE